MGWGELIIVRDEGLPVLSAILAVGVSEELEAGKTYITGQAYPDTIRHKGIDYTPGPLQVFTTSDRLTFKKAAPGYEFIFDGETYQVSADGTKILLRSAGVAVLPYVITSIGPNTPTNKTAFDITQAVATTHIATVPDSYFYRTAASGNIIVAKPLPDGVMFRQLIRGAHVWHKFRATKSASGEVTGGIFQAIDTPIEVSITAIKNINLSNLGNLEEVVAALDLFDGKAPPIIFTRTINGVRTRIIEQTVLLLAQDDPKENGPYSLSCIDKDNAASTAARISPLTKDYQAFLGRNRIVVWQGDKNKERTYWISSTTPVTPATGVGKHVVIDTTPHTWQESDPTEDLYDRLDLLEKTIDDATITEADPIALAEIERVTDEIKDTIAALPPDRAEEIAALTKEVEALDTTKADKTSVDELNKAIKALNDAIALGATDEELAKAKADLSAAIAVVEAAEEKFVVEWANRGYKAGRIVARQNAFFKCVITHIAGIDPLTDKDGRWVKFPEEGNAINSNRSPLNTDLHPEGTTWNDLSFGATTPLRFLSMGGGKWVSLNQITLTRIRFNLYGNSSTYQSRLSNIKFYKADETEMPNGWFIWGARAGLGGQSAGTNYTGQSITAQYNASGWAELEPSPTYDVKESISKVTGSSAYINFTSVTFFYSNGGSKTFTPSGGNLATCDPPLKSRFGDGVESALGEILTAAKLSNPDSTDPGRVTGQAFVSAVRTIAQSLGAKQEIIRSTQDPDYTREWETWRKVTEDLIAWTITVTEYARLSEDSSMPMVVRTEPLRSPVHENATLNSQGEFAIKLPGGGEFVYTTSRNGGNNYATFPADVYKEVASYYVDAADAVIPKTTMAQQVAPGSTALGVGAIAISTEAIAFVVDFYRMDNSKITYRVPLRD